MNDKDEAWDQVKETRDKIQLKIKGTDSPTKTVYMDLLTEVKGALDQITLLRSKQGFPSDREKEVDDLVVNYNATKEHFEKVINEFDQSATNIEAKSPAGQNANKGNSAIIQMRGFLALAASNSGNRAKIDEYYNKFINLRSKVGHDEASIKQLAGMEQAFKSLLIPPQLSSGASAASAQAVAGSSAQQKNNVVVAKEVAPHSAQTKESAPAEAAVEQARPAPRSSGPAMEVKVDEGVLPAGGLSKSELQKQLTDIAKDNKWGISFPGNDIKIVDQGQSVTVSPTKDGMKIEGSSELGVKVLDKWCEKNKFDKLDVKVKMPTVDKNIDASSPEGAAAFKTFEEYTKKGFYVKDKEGKPFPIDNFKPAAGQDQTQFNALKAQYTDMQQRVESKAEQKIGPSAAG